VLDDEGNILSSSDQTVIITYIFNSITNTTTVQQYFTPRKFKFPNQLPASVVYFSRGRPNYLSASCISIGFAILESVLIIKLLFENGKKFRLALYKAVLMSSIFISFNLFLHVTVLDYQTSAYKITPKSIATWAVFTGCLTCTFILFIYICIATRLKLFFKVFTFNYVVWA